VAGFIPASGDEDSLGGYKTRPYDPGTPLHQLNRSYFLGKRKGKSILLNKIPIIKTV
jgi:hypothetical protein